MATTGTEDTAWQGQRTNESDQSSRDCGADASGGRGQTLRDVTYQKLTDQKTRASETLGSVAVAQGAVEKVAGTASRQPS